MWLWHPFSGGQTETQTGDHAIRRWKCWGSWVVVKLKFRVGRTPQSVHLMNAPLEGQVRWTCWVDPASKVSVAMTSTSDVSEAGFFLTAQRLQRAVPVAVLFLTCHGPHPPGFSNNVTLAKCSRVTTVSWISSWNCVYTETMILFTKIQASLLSFKVVFKFFLQSTLLEKLSHSLGSIRLYLFIFPVAERALPQRIQF